MNRIISAVVFSILLAVRPAESQTQLDCPPGPTDQIMEMLVGQIMMSTTPTDAYRELETMSEMINSMSIMLGDDPCAKRQIELMRAMLLALKRDLAEADELFRRHLTPLHQRGTRLSIMELFMYSAHATVMGFQRRDAEFERTINFLLPLITKRFGSDHPFPLSLEAAKADMLSIKGDYSGAADILDSLWSQLDRALPSDHPVMCGRLITRARAYFELRDPAQAISLTKTALDSAHPACRQILTPDHPWTGEAYTINGRAHLSAGTIDQAGQALDQGRGIFHSAFGPDHPETLEAISAQAELAALNGDVKSSVELVHEIRKALLNWLGPEIQGTVESPSRRKLVSNQEYIQDLAIQIALMFPNDAAAQDAAAEAVLSFKGIRAEEDAALSRLLQSPDVAQDVRAKVQTFLAARAAMTGAEIAASTDLASTFRDRLQSERRQYEAAKAELLRASGLLRRQMGSRRVGLEAVRKILDNQEERPVLIEYRKIQNRMFGQPLTPLGKMEFDWVAIVIEPSRTQVVRLGASGEVESYLNSTTNSAFVLSTIKGTDRFDVGTAELFQEQAKFLYQFFVAPLGVDAFGTVILSPDAELGIVQLGAFRKPDGSYWILDSAVDLVMIQSGRALLEEASPVRQTNGFLGIGGVEYGAAENNRFEKLTTTLTEVKDLGELFEAKTGETKTLLVGPAATEAALRQLKGMPRVLHFSSHGFYDASKTASDDLDVSPVLAAGIALADANLAIGDPGKIDGILFASEVLNLNLAGTELVVLSACQSGLGAIERGEGIHGLARSFKIAGAKYFLVAQRPVLESHAHQFVDTFYRHWLAEKDVAPHTAFASAIREIVANGDEIDWAAFQLFKG